MSQPQFSTYIINNWTLFEALKKYSEEVDSDLLTYDVETNGKNEKTADLFGIGLAFTISKAFYVPWRNPDGSYFWNDKERAEIIVWLRILLKTRKLIGHNIIYDALVTEKNLDINIDDNIHADTILMKHTVDEEPPFALKEIAVQSLGDWADNAQEKLKDEVLAAGGRWTKDQKDMYLASTQTLGEYCCWDVILTLMLYFKFNDKIYEEGLQDLFYNTEVMPLYREVTINMKRKGFPIDRPYYQRLKQEIGGEIDRLEDEIMRDVSKDISQFEQQLLDEEYPVKSTGNFPKAYAEVHNIVLPATKDGKITLAAKAVAAQAKAAQAAGAPQAHLDFYNGLINKSLETSPTILAGKERVQRKMYFDSNPDCRYVFNLRSNDHLIDLIFNKWGFKAGERTPTGKPKLDDEYLESLKGNPAIDKLKDYKKLNKLLSTYVDGILDREVDGYIYTSMLQFGTTSGRYSSRDPNLQNQPRIKEEDSGLSALVLKYVNAIRRGFIAGPGRKVVNADYSSLEPVCFAHMSGDEKLRDIFRNGEDLYSRVAIETFSIQGVSAIKKDPNYLGKTMKEIRQKSKVFCLAVPYGAEAARISEAMGVSYGEAQEIIDNYLNGFPSLKTYMHRCNYMAKTRGYVQTEFGRIRHLKEARSIYTLYGDRILDWKYANKNGQTDIRRKFKNSLNNAKNFPIQGLAAHIVNRAMIAIAREFKKHNIDGWIALQVHDEITCIIAEHHAQLAVDIMRNCMENTTKISVPLMAEPLIADSWADAK